MAERIPKTDYEVTKRMLVVEMVGTWGIAYCGGLLVIAADEKKMDLTAVAIGHTFVVAFFVWASAGISGAHINGAVSLAFWVTGAISPKKFWLYTAAQMVGSLLAGVMLRIYLWNDKKYGNSLNRWPSSLGFPHADLVNWDTSTCFIMETLGTFFLVGTVFLTAFNSTRPKSDVYGFCIGAMVGVWILMIGPITGCSLNPQRVLGPAIVSGQLFKEEYDYAYIYYVGDYLGGAIFGIVWWFFFADWNKNELKYSTVVRQDSDIEEVHDKLAPKEAKKIQDCYINEHKGKAGFNNKKKLYITIVHDNLLEANGQFMVNLAGAKFDSATGKEIIGDYVSKSTAHLGDKILNVKHSICKIDDGNCVQMALNGLISDSVINPLQTSSK